MNNCRNDVQRVTGVPSGVSPGLCCLNPGANATGLTGFVLRAVDVSVIDQYRLMISRDAGAGSD
jgi:hypothetical protein